MSPDKKLPGYGAKSSKDGHDFLFEVQYINTIIRVAALDAKTGTEVVVQGPASAGADAVVRVAERKLIYVLQKGKTS